MYVNESGNVDGWRFSQYLDDSSSPILLLRITLSFWSHGTYLRRNHMNNLVIVKGGRDTSLWNIPIFVKIQTVKIFWTLWVEPVTLWTLRSHTLNCCPHRALLHFTSRTIHWMALTPLFSLYRDISLAGHEKSFTDCNGWQEPFGIRWYILTRRYYLLGFQRVASMWWVA